MQFEYTAAPMWWTVDFLATELHLMPYLPHLFPSPPDLP